MNPALEELSKEEIIALFQQREQVFRQQLQHKDHTIQEQASTITQTKEQVELLQWQVDQLKRMAFGQKRERFEADGNQLPLPFEATPEQTHQQEEGLVEKIEYVRKKQSASAQKGRVALPEHLEVEEVEIFPEGDLEEMQCIGKEVTEELECAPAKLFIRRYIRYKYAPKNKEGVVIGELPERIIDKGIPGPGLLASILVDKYVDHLPLYRQRQRFLRENIPIAASTLDGWARAALEKLQILYDHLVEDTKVKGYLQADETPIKVLDKEKKAAGAPGATHQGYYWVYNSPIDKTVLFDYQPTRGASGPDKILSGFKGYLQTDGYKVYDKIGRKAGVTHLACWAHARREFDKALDNDKARASMALLYIQQLYAVEAQAREKMLAPEQRKELRLEKSLPILNDLGKWISKEVKTTLPKSPIGKAMRYSQDRWDALSAYLYDGVLEIDNNLVENTIRPVALGRKNYLFAGSHQAAQRAAIIYSFFAICKKHEVNPFQWLKHTLENIMSINHKNIRDLYPQNYLRNNC
jgi:transposase